VQSCPKDDATGAAVYFPVCSSLTVRELRAIFGWIDGRMRLRWALLVPIVCLA
jgi:hypothetical protein